MMDGYEGNEYEKMEVVLMSTDVNPLATLSEAMAEAVSTAGASTVMVDARHRLLASGIGYGADLVLTADHVVERDEDISILLPDGSEHPVTVAGRDPGSDLILLRVSKPVLTQAQPAPGEARVGQLTLALGRPTPDGIQASLGIVSAVGGPVRTGRGGLLERYLRTDATPYPGFSGGPLVDVAGRILGLNTSGLTRGASLAIPVSLAWQVADALLKHGSVRRGYLGVRSQPVMIPPAQQKALNRQQESGLLLVNVEAGTPAEAGGMLVGDIIVAIAGSPVTYPDDLLARLAGELIGRSTPVEVLRGGQPVTLNITIGERP